LKNGARGQVLFDVATTRPIALIEVTIGTPVVARITAAQPAICATSQASASRRQRRPGRTG
jgi:hypothetical protein